MSCTFVLLTAPRTGCGPRERLYDAIQHQKRRVAAVPDRENIISRGGYPPPLVPTDIALFYGISVVKLLFYAVLYSKYVVKLLFYSSSSRNK